MVFFRRKKEVSTVPKHEFFHFAEHIKSHFSRLKDLQMHTLSKVHSVHESHNQLSRRVNEDSHNLTKWLSYFHDMHLTHNNDIKEMKKSMAYLHRRLDDISKIDEQYIKSIVENYVQIPQKDKAEFKKDVIEVLKDLRKEKMSRDNVNNVNVVNNDNGITRYKNSVISVNTDQNRSIRGYNDYNEDRDITLKGRYNVNNVIFTKSESKILGKLFESTTPLAYLDLARITGHSPNTVKVYINALKKKGVAFDEIDAPNGTKLYAVPNKEKVRKLYNF